MVSIEVCVFLDDNLYLQAHFFAVKQSCNSDNQFVNMLVLYVNAGLYFSTRQPAHSGYFWRWAGKFVPVQLTKMGRGILNNCLYR
jgi:hypothetical protein